MSYEFNTFVVWKHKSGKIYCACDSGCSCPTPFEDCHSLKDLTLIDSMSKLKYEVDCWVGDNPLDEEGYNPCSRPGKELLETCDRLLFKEPVVYIEDRTL